MNSKPYAELFRISEGTRRVLDALNAKECSMTGVVYMRFATNVFDTFVTNIALIDISEATLDVQGYCWLCQSGRHRFASALSLGRRELI